MTKRFRLPKAEPLFDIGSYAPGGRREGSTRLSAAEIEFVRRTVNRVPEALVKVLSRGSNDVRAAAKHVDYIGRNGVLELENEDGERSSGRIGKALVEDWDLDIDEVRHQSDLRGPNGGKTPKLIHKVVFSMPPGTSPQKVLAAVRNFAREEFWGQHRYAFVLHTDEPHPHVHVVLKAMSEQGTRLNIRRATLRHWRSEFARHLRALGVAANATERAVRGGSRKAYRDAIFRASLRGDSSFVREQVETVARGLASGAPQGDDGRSVILETRMRVVAGWRAVAGALRTQAPSLSIRVAEFARDLSPPQTERERLAEDMLARAKRSRLVERGSSRLR